MGWKTVFEKWRAARGRRWVRWAVDLAIVLLVFASVTAWQTRRLLSGGEPAPAFELTDLHGKTWRLADLRGRKVVIEFWAPWCGVCRAQSGAISHLREAVGDEVEVLSVALSWQDRAEIDRFVQAARAEYPVLLGDDRIQRDYRITSFPTIYFLDEDGAVMHTVVGYTPGFGLRWRTWF